MNIKFIKVFSIVAVVLMGIAYISGPAFAATKVYVNKTKALTTINFATRNGLVRCNLPNEIRTGDTISGIIQIEGKGSSKRAKVRYEKKLNEYIVKVGACEAYVRIGTYRLKVPKNATSLSITLHNKKGSNLASTSVDVISKSDSKAVAKFQASKCVESNKPIKVDGDFTGDYRLTNISANDQKALILTESPRCAVFQSPGNMIGEIKIKVKRGSNTYEAKINALSITSSMVTTRIARGKSHSLLVRLSGMEAGGPSVMVKLKNLSPNVVNLEGGDVQSIGAKSDTGTWEVRREVHGQKIGSFKLQALLIPSTKKVSFKSI